MGSLFFSICGMLSAVAGMVFPILWWHAGKKRDEFKQQAVDLADENVALFTEHQKLVRQDWGLTQELYKLRNGDELRKAKDKIFALEVENGHLRSAKDADVFAVAFNARTQEQSLLDLRDRQNDELRRQVRQLEAELREARAWQSTRR